MQVTAHVRLLHFSTKRELEAGTPYLDAQGQESAFVDNIW